MVEMKKPLIFVSHSSKNRDQVKLLVELLRAINLQPQKDIFCSSLPGYDIPIGMDLYEFLSSRFLEYDLHVICVHSKEYYESPVSLNEMGAAWALKKQVTSILLPGFEFGEMRGVINDRKIAVKLDNDLAEVKDKLNQLRKMMVEEFNLVCIPDIAWEEARDKFINTINQPMVQVDQLTVVITKLLQLVVASSDGVILTSSDMEVGMSIKIEDKIIVSEIPDRRKYAKWNAALEDCLSLGYIEQKGKGVYVITHKGYNFIDNQK